MTPDGSEPEPPAKVETIACDRHGRGVCAIICQHHVRVRDRAVGFIENCSDPHDLQAWCRACEERFVEEGAITHAFQAFNSFAVVCATCYQETKWRHTERGARGRTRRALQPLGLREA